MEKRLKRRLKPQFRKRIKPTVKKVTPLPETKITEDEHKKNRDREYNKHHPRKSIRFTSIEWERIEAQLIEAEINFTEFAKHKLLDTKIKYPAILKSEAAKVSLYHRIHTELNAQGNNLNLITKKLNKGNPLNIQFLQKVEAIKKSIEEIQKSIT